MEFAMELAGFRAVGEILGPGVYALVWRGQVVYVGQSRKMLARIYAHKTMIGKPKSLFTSARGVRFDDLFICPCPIAKLDALEAEMINLYKPRYNIRVKSPTPISAEINLSINGIALTLNRKGTTSYTTPAPGPQIERRI